MRRHKWSLRRRSVSGVELAVASGPDTFDAATRSDEEGSGSKRNEGHQESVFDQVLALIFPDKSVNKVHTSMVVDQNPCEKFLKVNCRFSLLLLTIHTLG